VKRTIPLFLLICLVACSITAPVNPTAALEGEAGWYSLYFTHPGEAGTGLAVESALVESIDAAQQGIDLALYSFSLSTIADALIDATGRGVPVRVVMEADNADSAQAKRLTAAGIPIRPDTSGGLMHDKFVIIDGREVWTGSMNLTITSAQEDANNLIRLSSGKLAADYEAEFEAMFSRGAFGTDHIAEIPYPLVTLDGAAIEVYFSPNGNASRRLVELVSQAQDSVVFLASNFTSDPLSAAMLSAWQRGVRVEGLLDADNAVWDTGSDYLRMQAAGIPIELDHDPGTMHHKVLIIDGGIVVLGSYNFTASAEYRNDENLLIIHDPELAGKFIREYQRLID
jgi:phosphatidylserine/phosphatidylglycerophosphate/cardiolipin synthase-like enzyme